MKLKLNWIFLVYLLFRFVLYSIEELIFQNQSTKYQYQDTKDNYDLIIDPLTGVFIIFCAVYWVRNNCQYKTQFQEENEIQEKCKKDEHEKLCQNLQQSQRDEKQDINNLHEKFRNSQFNLQQNQEYTNILNNSQDNKPFKVKDKYFFSKQENRMDNKFICQKNLKFDNQNQTELNETIVNSQSQQNVNNNSSQSPIFSQNSNINTHYVYENLFIGIFIMWFGFYCLFSYLINLRIVNTLIQKEFESIIVLLCSLIICIPCYLLSICSQKQNQYINAVN